MPDNIRRMNSDEPEPISRRRPDPLTPEQRRLNMSRIRSRDTKPEMVVRKGFHGRGLRYRLHVRSLPGTPDLVFPSRRCVILVHGCFWHGHDCPRAVTPGTNTEFWTNKIARNRLRDQKTDAALQEQGWRVLTIWECALSGKARRGLPDVLDAATRWLDHGPSALGIAGEWAAPPAG